MLYTDGVHITNGPCPDGYWEIPDQPSEFHWFNGSIWIYDISRAKVVMWERIKAKRDLRTLTGGYPFSGKWYHSDTFSRTQILGLVLLGANIPPTLMWKTMDGSFVSMTQTLAVQIFGAAATQDTATFQAAEIHKANMEASTSPHDYDFSSGWPLIYGE